MLFYYFSTLRPTAWTGQPLGWRQLLYLVTLSLNKKEALLVITRCRHCVENFIGTPSSFSEAGHKVDIISICRWENWHWEMLMKLPKDQESNSGLFTYASMLLICTLYCPAETINGSLSWNKNQKVIIYRRKLKANGGPRMWWEGKGGGRRACAVGRKSRW